MTSPAGAISNASYRGGTWQPQGYPQAQQAYRYSAPLTAQPAFAYTQHTPTTVSQDKKNWKIIAHNLSKECTHFTCRELIKKQVFL